ncbi:Glutathione-regulated potassium-efflux system protein KefC [Ephemeroptericola cinctiostellae]|uniref:Glutathione-regulated potassium-efflux system protein KefC n=1 Tax=Ephemeroptericola cinctiostellae TaxID=2268024 RepID=A0A345DBF3_9BURK|nr:monovalent cation:proton antiporter-2 (CPA2) family protein [Ephemeroptericola cinctiostellae]AXF85691.1 Glutathione-regulated potassium-efflux system protein KefC [Ephemeroptericola cinctiostellae]
MHGEINILFYLMIYLTAMVLVVPIAKRLGLGVVLGYLLAGLALGPNGFRLTENTESINTLAELGVVLMLFTIGLELDGQKLWDMRHRVFIFGALQMVVCAMAFFGATYLLGMNPTAALIIGLALALSSTAVAVQMMNDRNLMNTDAGKSVFGVLLFQDMAAIPLIIAIGLLAPVAGATQFNALNAIGAVLAVIFIGRYLIRYMLRWVAQNGSRELFVGTALLLVIAVMELMTSVGVSAGLGAFLAGILLASSEYRHELEADLNPFRGLFLGLFFITIGSSMDIPLLLSAWPRILGLLLAYMTVKFILLYLIAGIVRIQARERLTFALMLGQGGEFAFVVGALAVQGKLFNVQQGAWLNLIVALSLAASPLLIKLFDIINARYFTGKEDNATMDTDIKQREVIVAGFGRFGQIISRLLFSAGIRPTVLDHDSSTIETMRKFGYKVYFGDAARLDLLEVAGAATAKLLVVAVEDREVCLKIIHLAQRHFPHLEIAARAYDVSHYYDLRKLGVTVIERELFEGSLRLGRECLRIMGMDAYEARELTNSFRDKNYEFMHKNESIREDKNFASIIRQGREELERQLQEELNLPKVGFEWQEKLKRAADEKL